ncbi:MAG: hypothetical protein LBU79_07135 [Planctomycetota bacterium]|jgi:hypothetical protein|nr:hypothetical protein [Planctomycetota bacterium]
MAPTSIDDIKAKSELKRWLDGWTEGWLKEWLKEWLVEWLEGEVEGEVKGKVKGKVEVWLEEWLEGKWNGELKEKVEGKLEGKLEAIQNNIMTVLAVRFGPAPTPVKENIIRCPDYNLLENILVKSLEAKTMDEFTSHLS